MGSNPGRSWMYIGVFLCLLYLMWLEALRGADSFSEVQAHSWILIRIE